jgi:hypothetical protein
MFFEHFLKCGDERGVFVGRFRSIMATHGVHSALAGSGSRHGRLEGASGLLSAQAVANRYT